MAVSAGAINHPSFDLNGTRRRTGVIKCCRAKGRKDLKFGSDRDYYTLLGVSPDSTSLEIKEAYRNLQKKHHPDVAGQKGHEYTLKLNEAYRVLMREDLRRDYNASAGRSGRRGTSEAVGYSSWRGPLRPQALFVDENACIGCRECVHNASNTFVMDDELGCARVRIQYGDDDQKLEVSVDSCPVNCIHWIDREDLPVLEFVIRPRTKDGYGVFGGGWERPSNVFAAAKAFTKEMERQNATKYASAPVEEESPAQAKARMDASAKMRRERFSMVWDFIKGLNSNIWKDK
ncbi:hypothetical protein MLD38_022682 [Melastoma candidum]|uniref:Uncharacterized protein n=1 Tax=Melastoma candidum TaxID=119954 RepID=A0ACB9QJ88_9MYRT|nr:hypothetical protein MLD38_022682 [Melastoma candidum]